MKKTKKLGKQSAKHFGFQNCPVLGVGLGFRHQYIGELLSLSSLETSPVDWLEYTPENYMGFGGYAKNYLNQLSRTFPLVPHGVSMSIGSVDEFNKEYLEKLEKLFEEFNPPWFSDHLCFSSVDGNYTNDLIPLPRTNEAVNHVANKIKFLQDRFQKPVLIENVSFYLDYPESSLEDSDFTTKILEEADCGFLLDVNNIYVNSQNHKFNPYKYLDNLPLGRVVQVHVAGHTEYPDGIIDTHGNPVKEEVWDLLDYLLKKSSPCGVMIERDLNLPPFAELLTETKRVRDIWKKYQPELFTDSEETAEKGVKV